jgi:hypothetical protein
MKNLDHLYAQKPLPLAEHLCIEVAKHCAQSLSQWPLPMEQSASGALVPLPAHRPHRDVFVEAFALARLELLREFEAIDDYFRNRRFEAQGLTAADAPVIRFLTRYLLEQVFSVQDATEGRLKREQLLIIIDLTKSSFLR